MTFDPESKQPHDALFKAVMSRADAMRDFMQIHLPAAWLEGCDLTSLQLQSETLIEDALRSRYGDLLWRMRTYDGGSGYVYALIEHQSTPDPHMAFRLLRYAVDIMQRHFNEHKTLPLVIPVLFYAGEKRYNHSMRWTDNTPLPDIARQIYHHPDGFPLVDITTIPDEKIRAHRRIALLEFVQKNIARKELMDSVHAFASLLAKQILSGYTDENEFMLMLNYALITGDTDDERQFLKTLSAQLPTQEETIMTLAQRIENRGLKEGITIGKREGITIGKREGITIGKREGITIGKQEGITIGEMRGKQETRLAIARNMLERGMSHQDILALTNLSESELASLL